LTILKGVMENGRWAVGAGYLTALSVIFISMARIVLPMVFGRSNEHDPPLNCAAAAHEALWYAGPTLFLCAVVLLLGIYIPAPAWNFLIQAAHLSGGR
jgi:hypothetical protein